MEICPKPICTGCAACRDVCPKQCISMEADSLSVLYPSIKEDECVDCGLCKKACPNNNEIVLHEPKNIYAAWSKDEEQRKTSASGGVAYELYKYFLQSGGKGAGVTLDKDGCRYILLEKLDNIEKTKNSKYVYSETDGIYKKIRNILQDGHKVIFIGLPCQVAGLKSYLKKEYEELTTVDIICHGVAPYEYLRQHIQEIENTLKQKTHTVSFRDPRYYTYTFTLTLSNESGKEFYARKVTDLDAYQISYHRALTYRDNCYECKYARRERIGDLTIGDFSGLGTLAPIDYPNANVSCVLCNTAKGEDLIGKLRDFVTFNKRPLEEAFNYEKQLKAPSVPHPKRKEFERVYKETQSFRKATDICLRKDRVWNLYVKIKAFCYNNIIRLPYRAVKYIGRKLCNKKNFS